MIGYKEARQRILEGELDAASEDEKSGAVRELIVASSAAATVIALQPFPFLDIWLLAPIHVGMVQGIARIRGYRLDKKSVLEILRTLRQSFIAQHTTIAVSKLVPAFGWIASISAANALTYAIGEVSDFYFRMGRSILPAEMRAMLDRVFRERFTR